MQHWGWRFDVSARLLVTNPKIPHSSTCRRVGNCIIDILSGLVESNDIWRCLNKFDEDTFPTERMVRIPFWMNEGYIVTTRALSDAARREANSILLEPYDTLLQRMYPKTYVVQGRLVHPVTEASNGISRESEKE